jgi:hypothetical protein
MSKSDHKNEPSPSPAPVTVTVGAGDGALDARSDALQRVAFAMDRLLTDLSSIKRGDNATIDGRFGYRSRALKDLNRDRKPPTSPPDVYSRIAEDLRKNLDDLKAALVKRPD